MKYHSVIEYTGLTDDQVRVWMNANEPMWQGAWIVPFLRLIVGLLLDIRRAVQKP